MEIKGSFKVGSIFIEIDGDRLILRQGKIEVVLIHEDADDTGCVFVQNTDNNDSELQISHKSSGKLSIKAYRRGVYKRARVVLVK
jgi:hypothetical protein